MDCWNMYVLLYVGTPDFHVVFPVLTRIRIYHNCFAVVCFVMIPRSLVKHQYESVGTKDGLSGPAVFLFPAKGAHLVQLQPSNNAEQRLCFAWVRQSEEEWGV